MEPVLFILLITVAGSSAFGIFNQCEISRCNTFTPDDLRRTMRKFPPNEEELREICPPVLEVIECFSSMTEECIADLFEGYRASENVTAAQVVSTIQNVMSLIRDVCDEESQIGRDFRASAPCLKKFFSEGDDHCRSESYRLYQDFRLLDGSGEEDKFPDEVKCLTAAYEMACNLKDIHKTCGSMARDVVLEMVRRPKAMLNMGMCSEEDLLTLKGQFLDFLEEQGEHRAFFANAFEFRKRRK